MATNPTKLKSATVYLPGGRVKRFDGKEVAAWAVLETGAALVVVGRENGITRYVGFPVTFEEEFSAIQVAGPGEMPLL